MTSRIATALLGVVLSSAPVLAADTYEVDPVHSTIAFRVMHAGIANFHGLINAPTGAIVVDSEEPSKTSITVEAKVDNVYTANPKRDDHLKSEDFFSGKQFPTISFKSRSAKKLDDNTLEVQGDFSLHGVTKPITVKVEKTGEGDKGQPLGYRTGWHTVFTIKRSDFNFGSKFGPDMLGEEVTLMVGIEAQRK